MSFRKEVEKEKQAQQEQTTSRVDRRKFLGGLTALCGVSLIGSSGLSFAQTLSESSRLPHPAASGIEHIVLVTMENRSFDHILGWLPGANGRQAGLSYKDARGVSHFTYHLLDYQGCGHPDPDHSYIGGRVEYDNGRCDGWLRAGANDIFSIGYYDKKDLPFLGHAAPEWTVCKNYFAAIMAETYPNRIFQHAAQTDRLTNTTTISTLPTIWDLLQSQNVPANYYFSDVPFLALWGAKYVPISRPVTQFYTDALAGTLPAVSYVDPRFLGESQGLSNDDHPHGDIRNGEAFLSRVYSAVTLGAAWSRTVLIINFDEWGGFFEHVPPARAAIPPATAAAGDTDGRRGFRVPCLVISPWSEGGFSSQLFDHNSVLKMIEWRHSLPNLTVRDQRANNLAMTLDFDNRARRAPLIVAPQGPFGTACGVPDPVPGDEEAAWIALLALAAQSGFAV